MDRRRSFRGLTAAAILLLALAGLWVWRRPGSAGPSPLRPGAQTPSVRPRTRGLPFWPRLEPRSVPPETAPPPTLAPAPPTTPPETPAPPPTSDPASADAPPDESTPLGEAHGRAIGPDGRGARDAWAAKVSDRFLSKSLGERQSADDQGFFLVENLAAGERELQVAAPGLGPQRLTVRIEDGKRTELGEVRLEPAARIHGRVLDSAGRGLAKVKVRASSGFFGLELGEAITNGDGRFALEELPAGTLWLNLDPDDQDAINDRLYSLSLASGEDRELTLGGPPQLRGQLPEGSGGDDLVFALRLDTLADPLAGLLVAMPDFRGTEANETGGFAFGGLEPGRWLIGTPKAMEEVRIPFADGTAQPPVLALKSYRIGGRIILRPPADDPTSLLVKAIRREDFSGALAGDRVALFKLVVALMESSYDMVEHPSTGVADFALATPHAGAHWLLVWGPGRGLATGVAVESSEGAAASPEAFVELVPTHELTISVTGQAPGELLLAFAQDASGAPLAMDLDERPRLSLPEGRWRITVLRSGGRRLSKTVSVDQATGPEILMDEAADGR